TYAETVWNDTTAGSQGGGAGGGGYSDVFGVPAWQASVVASAGASGGPAATAAADPERRHPNPPGGPAPTSSRGRGVPDVAGNADPVTGYKIVANGQSTAVGGTSAVAPLWAGLIARLAQQS